MPHARELRDRAVGVGHRRPRRCRRCPRARNATAVRAATVTRDRRASSAARRRRGSSARSACRRRRPRRPCATSSRTALDREVLVVAQRRRERSAVASRTRRARPRARTPARDRSTSPTWCGTRRERRRDPFALRERRGERLLAEHRRGPRRPRHSTASRCAAVHVHTQTDVDRVDDRFDRATSGVAPWKPSARARRALGVGVERRRERGVDEAGVASCLIAYACTVPMCPQPTRPILIIDLGLARPVEERRRVAPRRRRSGRAPRRWHVRPRRAASRAHVARVGDCASSFESSESTCCTAPAGSKLRQRHAEQPHAAADVEARRATLARCRRRPR